jgi:16S rRNA processing protein RimM
VSRRPEFIVVGRIGRPRGISGEVYIEPATDAPDRFLELQEVYLIADGRRRQVKLQSVQIIGNRPVVRIEGVNSREEAARIQHLSIEIPSAQAQALPGGQYYQFDLIGCRVVGKDGTEYGEVTEVLFYPASDIYRITSPRFGETLLPAVDRFIVSIDIVAKQILIDPPAGLFVPSEEGS